LEKASSLTPGDSIPLSNVLSNLYDAACGGLVGDGIDLRALRLRGRVDLLAYLYRDRKGRDRYAERARQSQAVARMVAHARRLLVLSPKRPFAYSLLAEVHSLTGDLDALRELDRQLGRVELDLADVLQRSQDYYAGRKDRQTAETARANL